MAATAEASRLTEQQRRLQLALRALALRDLIAVWRLLDPTAVDATWPGVEAAVMRIVQARRAESAMLAARYLAAFRAAELGAAAGAPPAVPLAPLPEQALRVSLTVTGPATIKRLTQTTRSAEEASRVAMTRVAGAVGRYVLDGGRQMLTDTVRADRRALGWARIASGSACAFCAMLASRGPVYRSQRTAGFDAHDNCACAVEPVYRRDAAWPATSQRYAELWETATAGLSGKAAINAFRRALDAQRS